ncbi:hypothetical protein ES692_14315 [Psychroserpens burtonensis]|uniref:J domain-containing protein n=1 Tax=Psychroserpens burtonensis TaxID=49278 RepID=A0A5C7B3Z9_9FLAO|nr:DnaJ domain-containing protein [Psychroserpens burtonensis]TXE16087.1 hypothetical protein ES692_14315 [Psychroserpens burtonensis]
MNYKDYYKIVDINNNASAKEIIKAYRKLLAKCHPNKNPDDKTAEEKFKAIKEAGEVLSHKEKREKYDSLRSHWEAYQNTGDDWLDYPNRANESQRSRRYSQDDDSYFLGKVLQMAIFFFKVRLFLK